MHWLAKKNVGTDDSFYLYGKSFALSFFSFLLIFCVGCKASSLSELYRLLRVCLIGEHCKSMFSSQIVTLESFSINIFHFLNLFFHILKFLNPKSFFNHQSRVFNRDLGSI